MRVGFASCVFMASTAAAAESFEVAGTTVDEYCRINPKTAGCVATNSGPVKLGWENHFAAFGGQDVQRILKDYTEDSVIAVFNQHDGTQAVFTGLKEVEACFTHLFDTLYDTSDLAAPVIEVKEADGQEPGSVFLVWNAKASGYKEATDTFIFDKLGKIVRQNVVVTYVDPRNPNAAPTSDPASEAPTGTGPVHAAWANHLGAFGGQNVKDILKDYVEESVITVYNQVDGSKSEFKGLQGVKDCFVGLFKSLPDLSDLAAPIQHVEEGDFPSVFLIWTAGASGYAAATDTFIFNKQGKILQQNVVVHYQP